jgi:signal transduction histidine kinase
VLAHWGDARPAWLWSSDGQVPLWRNAAARLFNAKLKKHGLRLAPEAMPIKGQVARLIRLGMPGRTSLSRMQFLAGGRPLSATCSVTPLELPDRQAALLVVGVDPVSRDVLAAVETGDDARSIAFLPAGSEYLLIEANGEIRSGSAAALQSYAPILQGEGLLEAAAAEEFQFEHEGRSVAATLFEAAGTDAALLLLEPQAEAGPSVDEIRAEEGLAHLEVTSSEAQLPIGLPAPVDVEEPESAAGPAQERSLSALFDRLADHEELYSELSSESDADAALNAEDRETEQGTAGAAVEEEAAGDPAPPAPEPDMIAAVIEFAEDDGGMAESAESEAESVAEAEVEREAEPGPAAAPDTGAEAETEAANPPEQPLQYRVTGRGFTSLETEVPTEEDDAPMADEAAEAAVIEADPEIVERVSRYNFDELSRILSDRVSGDAGADAAATPPPAPPRRTSGDGALINLAAETFVLNRLPLGIMVFRDQQVLFANRALTDLTGHDSIDSLRVAGLASIFPQEAAAAGPVTHLLRRDGTPLPVSARLQSISWHGRPALMLSASLSETQFGQEGAVRAFAELLADASEEGFVTTDRAGVLTLVSLRAGVLLGRPTDDLVGQPLTALTDPAQGSELRKFLEQPARFAETARPCLAFAGSTPGTELLLFAEGQAGIVTGYFGFIRRRKAIRAAAPEEDLIEPSMLARISRGVRRPLNTIVGFADLIRSSAFGAIENQRYLEYARDIKTAGQEIAVLVDELDDFARLREGRYVTRPAELDLGGLLESCVVRVRGQASAARVLVRSGISERLPRIRADRASLGQAVLNLLASAIDQTPAGGSVIVSAQVEDDGSIVINVRDSGERKADLNERFVVFRDGVGREGEPLAPVRSSVGLALTRALLAVNTCSLSVEPTGGTGTLFSLVVPADLVAARATTA